MRRESPVRLLDYNYVNGLEGGGGPILADRYYVCQCSWCNSSGSALPYR